MLPRDLQWAEDDPVSFSVFQPITLARYSQSLNPDLSSNQGDSSSPLFTTDPDSEPMHYPYTYDVQVAWLRTSYYHAKHIVHRQCVVDFQGVNRYCRVNLGGIEY